MRHGFITAMAGVAAVLQGCKNEGGPAAPVPPRRRLALAGMETVDQWSYSEMPFNDKVSELTGLPIGILSIGEGNSLFYTPADAKAKGAVPMQNRFTVGRVGMSSMINAALEGGRQLKTPLTKVDVKTCENVLKGPAIAVRPLEVENGPSEKDQVKYVYLLPLEQVEKQILPLDYAAMAKAKVTVLKVSLVDDADVECFEVPLGSSLKDHIENLKKAGEAGAAYHQLAVSLLENAPIASQTPAVTLPLGADLIHKAEVHYMLPSDADELASSDDDDDEENSDDENGGRRRLPRGDRDMSAEGTCVTEECDEPPRAQDHAPSKMTRSNSYGKDEDSSDMMRAEGEGQREGEESEPQGQEPEPNENQQSPPAGGSGKKYRKRAAIARSIKLQAVPGPLQILHAYGYDIRVAEPQTFFSRSGLRVKDERALYKAGTFELYQNWDKMTRGHRRGHPGGEPDGEDSDVHVEDEDGHGSTVDMTSVRTSVRKMRSVSNNRSVNRDQSPMHMESSSSIELSISGEGHFGEGQFGEGQLGEGEFDEGSMGQGPRPPIPLFRSQRSSFKPEAKEIALSDEARRVGLKSAQTIASSLEGTDAHNFLPLSLLTDALKKADLAGGKPVTLVACHYLSKKCDELTFVRPGGASGNNNDGGDQGGQGEGGQGQGEEDSDEQNRNVDSQLRSRRNSDSEASQGDFLSSSRSRAQSSTTEISYGKYEYMPPISRMNSGDSISESCEGHFSTSECNEEQIREMMRMREKEELMMQMQQQMQQEGEMNPNGPLNPNSNIPSGPVFEKPKDFCDAHISGLLWAQGGVAMSHGPVDEVVELTESLVRGHRHHISQVTGIARQVIERNEAVQHQVERVTLELMDEKRVEPWGKVLDGLTRIAHMSRQKFAGYHDAPFYLQLPVYDHQRIVAANAVYLKKGRFTESVQMDFSMASMLPIAAHLQIMLRGMHAVKLELSGLGNRDQMKKLETERRERRALAASSKLTAGGKASLTSTVPTPLPMAEPEDWLAQDSTANGVYVYVPCPGEEEGRYAVLTGPKTAVAGVFREAFSNRRNGFPDRERCAVDINAYQRAMTSVDMNQSANIPVKVFVLNQGNGQVEHVGEFEVPLNSAAVKAEMDTYRKFINLLDMYKESVTALLTRAKLAVASKGLAMQREAQTLAGNKNLDGPAQALVRSKVSEWVKPLVDALESNSAALRDDMERAFATPDGFKGTSPSSVFAPHGLAAYVMSFRKLMLVLGVEADTLGSLALPAKSTASTLPPAPKSSAGPKATMEITEPGSGVHDKVTRVGLASAVDALNALTAGFGTSMGDIPKAPVKIAVTKIDDNGSESPLAFELKAKEASVFGLSSSSFGMSSSVQRGPEVTVATLMHDQGITAKLRALVNDAEREAAAAKLQAKTKSSSVFN